jgi:cytochrome c oxidase cbb3-type subunit 3
MLKLINKKSLLLLLGTLSSLTIFAQDASKSSAISISTNSMLLLVAFILLGVILMLALVVSKAIDLFKNKMKEGGTKNVITTLILLFSTFIVNAQDATTATQPTQESTALGDNAITLFLILIIVVEIGIIAYLIKQITFLTGIDALQKEAVAKGESVRLWDKINSFKPLEKEKDLDLGHSYDGIRELDNIAPPWFTIGFVFTILFAIVYMYRYHVSESAPLQIQEYENELSQAKAEKDAFEKLMPSKKVDENNLTLLGDADILAGKELFVKNCGTCHANDGGGGAGPNLTDNYWLHGGSLKNIFVTIRDGYPDKAMPAWSGLLNPQQIEQITSYVKSLKGTTPAVPKEKQGEVFNEETNAASTVSDSSSITASN